MIRTLLCLTALATTTLAAQQSPFVGTWALSYPGGAMMENGVVTPIMATGLLTVEATGDSLIATLVADPSPDLPARPPTRLAAKAGAGTVTFTSRRQAKLNMNGVEREAMAVSTWILHVTGETLDGTVETTIEGMEMGLQEPMPVTGSRKKGEGPPAPS